MLLLQRRTRCDRARSVSSTPRSGPTGTSRCGLNCLQRSAGRRLGLPEGALTWLSTPGAMAAQYHRLAGGEGGFDQHGRLRIFGQVPHRAMAPRIEDGIIILLLHALEAHRLVELTLGIVVLLEATGDVGLEVRILALGIERRAAAFGRCQRDLHPRVLENIVGRGQLLQPEAGFASGVAKLVMRG